MPTNTEEAVPAGFDPFVFWMENKSKVITCAVLLIGGLAAFAIYQISMLHNKAAAEALYAQAAKADDFRQVIQKYPRSIAAGNAMLMLAEAQRTEKKYDEAFATLRDFVNQFPDHPLAAGGALGIGTTLESQGKIDEAFDAYQQVAQKFPSSYAAPVALMAQANILAAKGKTDEAKRTYENVVSQFPDSIFAQQAMQSAKLLHK